MRLDVEKKIALALSSLFITFNIVYTDFNLYKELSTHNYSIYNLITIFLSVFFN